VDFERVRLEERMRRVRVLILSRFDYLPAPRTSSPETGTGPGEGKRVPCERCRRSGRVVSSVLRKAIPCTVCNGTGWRRRRKDDPPWDEYVAEQLSTGPKDSRVYTPRELDHEIDKLRQAAAERAGVIRHLRYGFERAHVARDLSGSYRELELALEKLPIGVRPLSDVGLAWISNRMRGTIHVPEWADDELAEQRRLVARSLVEHYGWSVGDVGRALGVSREKVGRWLKRARRAA
jgi:hypothetical protein